MFSFEKCYSFYRNQHHLCYNAQYYIFFMTLKNLLSLMHFYYLNVEMPKLQVQSNGLHMEILNFREIEI